MSTTVNDGGPAYPVNLGSYTGMTLRDHFAGLAMQGLLTNPDNNGISPYNIAKFSYDQADSMLGERNK